MLMQPEKINHPYLTAIKRTDLSVPTRYLLQHELLKGRILDFGCGFGYDTDELKKRGFDIIGYDYYYRPDYLPLCIERVGTICTSRSNDECNKLVIT